MNISRTNQLLVLIHMELQYAKQEGEDTVHILCKGVLDISPSLSG